MLILHRVKHVQRSGTAIGNGDRQLALGAWNSRTCRIWACIRRNTAAMTRARLVDASTEHIRHNFSWSKAANKPGSKAEDRLLRFLLTGNSYRKTTIERIVERPT